ncbi:MAG: carbohydrate ABC transporter permease, partial [Oscillospiraceae bacterium]|nr:carbohydrate ABC transporter permease [Oscillospiraceae bacterium]
MAIKKKQKIKADFVPNIIINIILVIIGLVAIYPLWFVIIASVSDPAEIAFGHVFLLPKNVSFSAYYKITEHPEILIGYRNSLFYLFAGSFTMLFGTLPAAYALSRKKLKGRKLINLLFVITMYFNGGMIPTYMLHKSIGWINTVWVMIVPGIVSAYYLILAAYALSRKK